MKTMLLIEVDASNVSAVMAALAPFGGAAPNAGFPQTGTAPPPPPAPPAQAAYPSNPPAPQPQMTQAYNPPPPPPAQPAPQPPQAQGWTPQAVYPAMQKYAAQFRADGIARVFAKLQINPPQLQTCTPDQLAALNQYFESMQPA